MSRKAIGSERGATREDGEEEFMKIKAVLSKEDFVKDIMKFI